MKGFIIVLSTKYRYGEQIKEDLMGGTSSMHGGKPEEKKQLRRSRRR
jgi:hypothetical protein